MISTGGAANLNPVQAASKALVEAVQTREWAKFLGRGTRIFNFAPDYSDIRDFEDHVALYAYGDMLPAIQFLIEVPNLRAIDGRSNPANGDYAADLGKAVTILAENGLDVIALDLTTPDVAACGYAVTRVLIPGLQPLDADYLHRFLGGTRLYQVPRRLGFSSSDTTFEQLNSYPHPYP
jgi:ribosomal protein S12 methylthiotransferase accessory factor